MRTVTVALDREITLKDFHKAPLEDVIKLRNLLYHWHQLAESEVQKRARTK